MAGPFDDLVPDNGDDSRLKMFSDSAYNLSQAANPPTWGEVGIGALKNAYADTMQGIANIAPPKDLEKIEVEQPDTTPYGQLHAEPLSQGYNDPKWWAAQLGQGTAEMAPGLAIASGAAAASPLLGPLAFGAYEAAQSQGPNYIRAREQGLPHEQAVARAKQESNIDAATMAAMGLAPEVSLFGRTAEGALKRPVAELASQTLGVQPAIGLGGQTAQTELEQGRLPTAEEAAQGYLLNAATGLPFAGAHVLSHLATPTHAEPFADLIPQAQADHFSDLLPQHTEHGLVTPSFAVGPKGEAVPVNKIERELDERGTFSPSLEAAKAIPQETGTVQQMTSMLLKAGAKPKELEAVGYAQAFPDPNAKVSKGQIATFLRENRVGLGQWEAGKSSDRLGLDSIAKDTYGQFFQHLTPEQQADVKQRFINRPRYESYSTPGGIPGSYREVVTTLPSGLGKIDAETRDIVNRNGGLTPDGGHYAEAIENIANSNSPDAPRARELIKNWATEQSQEYTSSHWPGITNPLLHYRVKDFYTNRPDATFSINPEASQKTRVLDEMQSDWAQRARDQGTRDPAKLAELDAAFEKAAGAVYNAQVDADKALKAAGYVARPGARWTAGASERQELKGMYPAAKAALDAYEAADNHRMDIGNKLMAAKSLGVPSAPFIGNTSDWVDLGLKQALSEAARDPTVTRFAWAPGGVQAGRYNLAKHVKTLELMPNRGGQVKYTLYGYPHEGEKNVALQLPIADQAALDQAIGKELSEKLWNAPEEKVEGRQPYKTRKLTGLDQIVGGEGMRSFYGDFSKEGKYEPGIVGTRLLKLVKSLDPEAAKIEAHDFATTTPSGPFARYPSIPITPKLREKLLGGVPMFSMAEAPKTREQKWGLVREKAPVDYPDLQRPKGSRGFDYEITRNGEPTGMRATGYVKNNKAHIDWIGDLDFESGPNSLGLSGVKQLREALRKDFPQVKYFEGERVSGARYQAGKEDLIQKVYLPSLGGPPPLPPFTPKFREALPQFMDRLGAFLDKALPPDVAVRVAPRLHDELGNELNGQFTTSKRLLELALFPTGRYEPSEVFGVAKHELIHALRQVKLFSDKEWATLKKAAADRGIEKLMQKDEDAGLGHSLDSYRDHYTTALIKNGYGDHPLFSHYLNEALDQELVARMAEDWAVGRGKYPSVVAGLFNRIKNFIEALHNAMSGMGFNHPDKVFQKAFSGKVAGRSEHAGEPRQPMQVELPSFAKGPREPVEGEEEGHGVPLPIPGNGPGEPPLAPGMVRMYHGGNPPPDYKGPLWFTSSRPYAEGWAGRSSSMGLHYVDIPETHPAVTSEIPGQGIKQGFTFSAELPGEIASKRRLLGAEEPDLSPGPGRAGPPGVPPPIPPGGGAGGPPPPPHGAPIPPPQPLPPKSAGIPVIRDIVDSWTKNIQPELASDKALQADPRFAEYRAGTAQRRDEVVAKTDEDLRKWNSIPEPKQLDFIDKMETGNTKGMSQWAVDQAHDMRRMLDAAYALEKVYGSKAAYIDNYLPHIWTKPEQARQLFQALAATNLGPTWFQKARQIDLIKYGLDHGLELETTNPMGLVQHRLLASADMVERMSLLRDLRDHYGLAFEGKNLPNRLAGEGWQKVNAPDRQQWHVAPDVAPLWKNAVEAKGLWSNEALTGKAFRAWMQFKNGFVPIKLSLSLFHPVHVLHINMAQDLARAWGQAFHGDLAGAAKSLGDVATGPVAAFTPWHKGIKAKQAWLKPESERSPEEQFNVKRMTEGGFSPQLSEQLRIQGKNALSNSYGEMLNNMRDGEYGKALARAGIVLPYRMGMKVLEKMQSPFFERWIPALKTAAYLNDAAAFFKAHPEKELDPIQRKTALRTIAKNIDNRFGEMFYSANFMNRTMKDAAIGSFLSWGWNSGLVRGFGGGLLEPPARVIQKAVSYKPSETRQTIRSASNKTANLIMYTTTALALGALATRLMTGKNPQGLNDMIFPNTGEADPYGNDRRLNTPFFTREVPMAAKHIQEQGGGIEGTWRGLGNMLWNKLMFEPFAELANNKNYYGYQIRDPNAPYLTQAHQFINNLAKNDLSPMAVSGYQHVIDSGGSQRDAIASFLGFGPAPAYANKTATQNLISKLYSDQVEPSVKPQALADIKEAKHDARMAYLVAKQKGDEQGMAEAQKRLAATHTKANFKDSYDVYQFSKLPAQTQASLLDNRFTPEEIKTYLPHASKKVKAEFNKKAASPSPPKQATNPFADLIPQ